MQVRGQEQGVKGCEEVKREEADLSKRAFAIIQTVTCDDDSQITVPRLTFHVLHLNARSPRRTLPVAEGT